MWGWLGAYVRAVFLPASYTSFGGWVSIITYAFATGLPIFLVAEWGALILKKCPDVRKGGSRARRGKMLVAVCKE